MHNVIRYYRVVRFDILSLRKCNIVAVERVCYNPDKFRNQNKCLIQSLPVSCGDDTKYYRQSVRHIL